MTQFGSIKNFPVVYDPARRVGKGPLPGMVALRKAAMARFPNLTNLGIYNPRNVRGGKTLSLHAEGRALDLGGPKKDISALVGMLYGTYPQLGVQLLIWDRQIWSVKYASQGWRTYTGSDPHTGHVHIELNREAGNDLTEYLASEVLGVDYTPPTPDDVFTLEIQEAVAAMGFDVGPIDGIPGPKTTAGIRKALTEVKEGRELAIALTAWLDVRGG